MMSDTEIAAQIARVRTSPKFRELVATTTTDPTSLCAAAHRRGLEKISETLDVVDYVYFANLANLNTAMRGELLGLVEVQLECVGGCSLEICLLLSCLCVGCYRAIRLKREPCRIVLTLAASVVIDVCVWADRAEEI